MSRPPCKTLEEVKEYVGRQYWEDGLNSGCSGYQNETINWWWFLRWHQCFNQVVPLRDRSFLDLGCALGSMVSVALAAGGCDAHGVDLSEYAIEKGHKLFEQITNRTHAGSIHDLSRFPDKRFDVIYSMQVFEHLPEELTSAMVNEITRVARDGALLWAGLVLGMGRSEDDKDLSHINIHPKEWWDAKFLAHGWIVDDETDRQLRQSTCGPDNPGFSYFKEYGWHTICYRKNT